jgi:hypothetical protein
MSQVRNWFERTFARMSHEAAPEVHRIGPSGSHIVRITENHIEYTDAAGRGQLIDLEECARNWERWYHDHRQEFLPLGSQAEIDAENAHTVGLRGGSYPLWWAEFMNERKTRFEFDTWEALWRKLQGPLMVAGWRTFDTE